MSEQEIAYRLRHCTGFRIFFPDTERDVVDETIEYLLAARRSVLSFLGLEDALGVLNVFICPGRAEYDRFVAHLTQTPTRKERIAQPQGADLYLISPNTYAADADCYVHPPDNAWDSDEYRTTIAHEIVHMVEEAVSPKGAMDVRAAWWSEGLAVYVSEQYTEAWIRDRLLEELKAGEIPTFERMESAAAYVWGWTVVCYIEREYGREALVRILLENNGRDVFRTIDRQAEVEYAKWKAFVSAPDFVDGM